MRPLSFNTLIAVLLGSCLYPAARGETPAIPGPADELSALRRELVALRTTLAERDASLLERRTRDEKLEHDLSHFHGAVALANTGTPAHRSSISAPSSTLNWAGALRAATAATLMVPDSALLTVMPTGSMEPMFNERAILLVEPARFEDLKIGDVVTYRHPQYNLVVVHRILEKHGDKFWAKGDNNGHMDQIYITRENYEARVFGIIYAREPSTQAQHFVSGLATN